VRQDARKTENRPQWQRERLNDCFKEGPFHGTVCNWLTSLGYSLLGGSRGMRPQAGERKTVRHKPWPGPAVLDKPGHQLTDSALFSHSVVSPLRYPGAKRQLFSALETIIDASLRPGCSWSLSAVAQRPGCGLQALGW
jgi:hypothetical protein